MQILANSKKVDIQDVRSNGGKVIDFVYVNRVLVWQRMLTINLGQQSKTFNLRSYINAHNPKDVKQVTVVNDRIQPSMESGNLSGLEVTFINGPKGELRGTSPGHTALHVTSKMKLLNDGWIRGAGNNGKAGSNGRNGAAGKNSVSKTVYWWKLVAKWSAKPFSTAKYSDGRGVDIKHQGWRLHGVCNSWLQLIGPCGSVANIGGTWASWDGALCGTNAGVGNYNRSGKNSRNIGFGCGAGEYKKKQAHSIAGSAGGAAGIGGIGGEAGVGVSFKTTQKNGGKGGGVRKHPGGKQNNSWKDPNGAVHWGNESGAGSAGVAGGNGTNGGGWGQSGDAISGKSFLSSGSNTGKTNGSIK